MNHSILSLHRLLFAASVLAASGLPGGAAVSAATDNDGVTEFAVGVKGAVLEF